jgi:hypothetical protein
MSAAFRSSALNELTTARAIELAEHMLADATDSARFPPVVSFRGGDGR